MTNIFPSWTYCQNISTKQKNTSCTEEGILSDLLILDSDLRRYSMYSFMFVSLQTLAMKESTTANLVGFHVLSTKVRGNMKGRSSRAPVTLI